MIVKSKIIILNSIFHNVVVANAILHRVLPWSNTVPESCQANTIKTQSK